MYQPSPIIVNNAILRLFQKREYKFLKIKVDPETRKFIYTKKQRKNKNHKIIKLYNGFLILFTSDK